MILEKMLREEGWSVTHRRMGVITNEFINIEMCKITASSFTVFALFLFYEDYKLFQAFLFVLKAMLLVRYQKMKGVELSLATTRR